MRTSVGLDLPLAGTYRARISCDAATRLAPAAEQQSLVCHPSIAEAGPRPHDIVPAPRGLWVPMPLRHFTLADFARDVMSSMEKDPWDARHERLDSLMHRRPSLVAKILELGSPDLYLFGKATGMKAPEVIPLPDRVRKTQRQLDDLGFVKRARR